LSSEKQKKTRKEEKKKGEEEMKRSADEKKRRKRRKKRRKRVLRSWSNMISHHSLQTCLNVCKTVRSSKLLRTKISRSKSQISKTGGRDHTLPSGRDATSSSRSSTNTDSNCVYSIYFSTNTH
jgi:hypothetical protein